MIALLLSLSLSLSLLPLHIHIPRRGMYVMCVKKEDKKRRINKEEEEDFPFDVFGHISIIVTL